MTNKTLKVYPKVTCSKSVADLALHGSDSEVELVYIHRSGREYSLRGSLSEMLNLAVSRSRDGRYKNFEFYLC